MSWAMRLVEKKKPTMTASMLICFETWSSFWGFLIFFFLAKKKKKHYRLFFLQDAVETLRPLQFILKSLQETYHDSERNFVLGNESLVAHRKWASSSDLVTDQEKNNITLTPVSQIRIMKSAKREQNSTPDNPSDANLVYNGSTPTTTTTTTPPERLTVSRYDRSILSPISDVDAPGSSPRKRVSHHDDLQSSLRRRSYRRAIASDDSRDQNLLERDRNSTERQPTPTKTSDARRRSRPEAPLIISSVDGESPVDGDVISHGDNAHKRLSRTLPDTRRYSNEGRRPSPGNKSSVITDQSRSSSPDRQSSPRATSPKPSPFASSNALRRSSGEKEAYSSSSSPRSSPRSSRTSSSSAKFLSPGHVARSPSRTSSSSSGSDESWHSVASSFEGGGRRRVRKMPRTPSPENRGIGTE